jgi:hypothetical protein
MSNKNHPFEIRLRLTGNARRGKENENLLLVNYFLHIKGSEKEQGSMENSD